VLLWRNAPKIWKAKGYSHTTVADALEKEFGAGRKLSRAPISLLVKTQCEPCPPDVEQFIRERLPVKNPETWAKYLAEVANEPPEENDAPPVTLQPRDFRELAREIAADTAASVRGWLDSFGGTLGAFITFARATLSALSGKLDALASSMFSALGELASAGAKLDTANSKLDTANAKLDVVSGKLDAMQTRLNDTASTIDRLTLKVTESRKANERMFWAVVVLCLLVLVLMSGRPTHPEASRAAEMTTATQQPPVVNVANGTTVRRLDLRVFLAALLDMGKKVEENWIPKEPFPGQKLAKDCKASLGERAINGGCWFASLDVKPPCGELFRHGDICYRPVAADPTKPLGLAPSGPSQP